MAMGFLAMFTFQLDNTERNIAGTPLHTAGLGTFFFGIYMDTPPGVPGVSKNQIYFLQIKLLSSCAKNDPKLQKL